MADIRHSIEIKGRPEMIYPLAATAAGFRQWWAEDITEPEGSAELGFFHRSTMYRLKLVVDRVPVRADWICETGKEWRGTHIVFELKARGPVTDLRFTHGGWQSETDYFISCNTTWGELMFRLMAAAEGESRGPLFSVGGMAY
jgi:hypothetical protein